MGELLSLQSPKTTKTVSERLPRTLEVLLAVVVLLELIAPFTRHSLGVDGPALLHLLKDFSKLFSEGAWIPRWNPEGFSRFGAPSYYFYPPLAFYAGAFLHMVTGVSDGRLLFYLTGLVATITSFFSARALMRFLGGAPYQSTIGALLYAFGPFRMAELYNRGSLSSHVGFAFLPLVALAIIGIVTNRRPIGAYVLLFAVALALVALTSVPLAALACIFGAVSAIVFVRRIPLQSYFRVAVGSVLAALLVAFHFSSSFEFSKFVNVHVFSTSAGSMVLDFRSGATWMMFYYLVGLYGAVVIAALAWWRAKGTDSGQSALEELVVIVGLLMMTVIVCLQTSFTSSLLWKYVVPLQLTVDYERYLILLMLFGATFVGIVHNRQFVASARIIVWLWVVTALMPAALVAGDVHLFAHAEFAEGDPIEYVPHPEKVLSRVEQYGGHRNDPDVFATTQSASFATIAQTHDLHRISADLAGPSTVVFRRFDWPAWHLFLDGNPRQTQVDTMGRVTASLPGGKHLLEWRIERTPLERAGLWTSAFAWGSVLLTACFMAIKRYR